MAKAKSLLLLLRLYPHIIGLHHAAHLSISLLTVAWHLAPTSSRQYTGLHKYNTENLLHITCKQAER